MSERAVRTTLGKLARKGLIGRIVKNHPNGRTKGVVFSIEPLFLKLRGRVKDLSPTEGEENFTYEGEETFTPNTREYGNKKRDIKNSSSGAAAPEGAREGETERSSADDISEEFMGDSLRETRKRYGVKSEYEDGGERSTEMPIEPKKECPSKDSYSPTRWYNEVFSEIYRGASGQPVLTGGSTGRPVPTFQG